MSSIQCSKWNRRETLVGENCEFIVANDGAFVFTMSKRNFPNSERSPFLFFVKKLFLTVVNAKSNYSGRFAVLIL